LFEKHHSFFRPWKKKGFEEERGTTIGLDDIGNAHDPGIPQEPSVIVALRGCPPRALHVQNVCFSTKGGAYVSEGHQKSAADYSR
jgi:hypothetical protein